MGNTELSVKVWRHHNVALTSIRSHSFAVSTLLSINGTTLAFIHSCDTTIFSNSLALFGLSLNSEEHIWPLKPINKSQFLDVGVL